MTTVYNYDGEGNQKKAGTDTYTYDHDTSGNQVTSAKDGKVTNRTQ
ncbi:hypothetical protein [Streptomyces longwoodensis]